jgi:integrase
VFYPLLEHAKVKRVRLHDLRHTNASLLIQNGESLAYVRNQLGHSSIQVTVDIDGHLVRGANRSAVDRLDAAPIPSQAHPTMIPRRGEKGLSD